MRLSMARSRSVVAAAVAIVGATAYHAIAVAEPMRHTRLVKSQPADGDTLTASPDSLRLWFSEDVQLPVTHIRVTRPGHTPRLSTPVVREAGGVRSVVVAIEDKLTAGTYRVIWKTAGPDGHPSTGVYTFVVRARR